jgi:hypothetical protein
MDPATAAMLVNGIIAFLGALPGIITSIEHMDAPEEDKAVLIARIKSAQANLPIWE